MIPGRNKPHILPGYKPADLYSPLIRIRRVTIFIVVNYKEGKLAAVVFLYKEGNTALRKFCRNRSDPAFRQRDLIGAVGKIHRGYFFCCYKLTKLLNKC